MREGGTWLTLHALVWVVAFNFICFCTAACSGFCALPKTRHGDINRVPLSTLQAKKKKKFREVRWLCPPVALAATILVYAVRREVRRCVCPLFRCCSRCPFMPDAVGLPVSRQASPAQHICALPLCFLWTPRPDFSSSESLRYCCCRRCHMVPASRGHVRTCTVCICKREHSTQRSCVL